MGSTVLFLSIRKIKMQQAWKGQNVSSLTLCMTSVIIKKLFWDNWYETWDITITKVGSICAHAIKALSHCTPQNIFLILHFMDILNYWALMIVLRDVYQYCVITQWKPKEPCEYITTILSTGEQSVTTGCPFPGDFQGESESGPGQPDLAVVSWAYALQLVRKGKTSKGKVRARQLGAERKNKHYPRRGANPYYYKINF